MDTSQTTREELEELGISFVSNLIKIGYLLDWINPDGSKELLLSQTSLKLDTAQTMGATALASTMVVLNLIKIGYRSDCHRRAPIYTKYRL